MRKKTLAIIVAIVVVILIIVVFATRHKSTSTQTTTSSSTSKTDTSNAVATNTVTLSNYMFSPATITVKAGTTVTWSNQDSVTHTVTSDDSSKVSFKSGNIKDGDNYTFTFDTAGTYTYHCTPHPYMHGTVIVTK